jgi:2-C-methyl-D-erythritol 4-phosphate cytidylyltransferase
MTRGPTTCAVILAAGEGRRAGGAKQFRRTGGRSLLYHAVAPFAACPELGGLIVVVPAGREVEATAELDDAMVTKLIAVVAGGLTRAQSSRAGIAALPRGCATVLIHDAARPFASLELIARVVRATRRHGAAVPVLAVSDSVVEVDGAGRLRRYLDRAKLRAVQTPQGFRRQLLEQALARRPRADFGDDASMVRAAGGAVVLIAGEPGNVKITTAEQLEAALLRLGGSA